MQSKLPLLPSGPGGVRKSAFHGPWRRGIKRRGFDAASNKSTAPAVFKSANARWCPTGRSLGRTPLFVGANTRSVVNRWASPTDAPPDSTRHPPQDRELFIFGGDVNRRTPIIRFASAFEPPHHNTCCREQPGKPSPNLLRGKAHSRPEQLRKVPSPRKTRGCNH